MESLGAGEGIMDGTTPLGEIDGFSDGRIEG